MKKLFTTVLALSLSLILLILSGCTGELPLTFNNAFNGAQEPDSSYRETLTYSVSYGEYEDIANFYLIKKEDFDFSAMGEYKTTFETVTKNDLPASAIATDIDLTAGTGNIYHVSSKLMLNTKYLVNGKGSGDYVDTLESEIYFLPSGMSFAPIYSNVVQKSTILSAENTDGRPVYTVSVIENQITILYNQSSYKITYKSGENAVENNYGYAFKTIIDNAELLFALRNVTVDKDVSTNLPVVSASYGEAKTLSISNVSEFESNVNLLVNGTTVSEKINVNKLKFNLNGNKNTGISQYLTVQKSASANIPSKTLITEYAHALMCYGTNAVTGALIYKLVSAEFSA